jgi:hypothetical protein
MALDKIVVMLAGLSVLCLGGCGDPSPSAGQAKDIFGPHTYTRPGKALGHASAGPPKGTPDNPK